METDKFKSITLNPIQPVSKFISSSFKIHWESRSFFQPRLLPSQTTASSLLSWLPRWLPRRRSHEEPESSL